MSENIVRTNFIRQIIDKDLESGKYQSPSDIHTRFPPEPNGYLHIGHAKSICLNFGIAKDYGGRCNLRFDDTNPTKEEIEYVEAIKADVEWLGFKWDDLFYASDYFEKFYEAAIHFIKKGIAYVDDSSAEEIREMRGTLTAPGVESPYRNRTVEENLDLFTRMRAGEFKDGEKVLRAKIDMSSPNMNMRDPALYRIRHESHHQTGDAWCIYPMYDFAHALSDAIEGITHSICTLEFEDHRPLYDWCVENAEMPHAPHQYEFSRLNIEYNVMSKRLLTQLVSSGFVDGWNDPRMPTISGLRRRGCPPEALRLFCERIGVTKSENMIELQQLSQSMRDVLNEKADRRMAVLEPLKVTLTNLNHDEMLTIANHPQDETRGTREINFSNTLYIDKADFQEEANKKYKRLVLDNYVRLRGAYIIKATDVVKDENGDIIEVIAEIVPGSLGKNVEGVKARGVIQWVSAKDAVDITVHNYDVLFTEKNPQGMPGELTDYLNKDSLHITVGKGEPALLDAPIEEAYQFERIGYYARDSKSDKLVFNRVVELKDSFGE
ncbi:glutamine--tRNA ligase/YqeY domain fusion protein [Ignatzschineria rhizosphaerae]|uniref:Glutamine--tRNA ligase n=1 Tax=Ignatzschineria rhizosphaerae TaxID=2923279 RepID=A0ABY3WWP5_9GAMM|nr:glutamine--tRNA ligase/YqeY domain fusion protein [Ignatzschineria rhizosphaerae]UNM95034.1 glutamine--tRNA ligase/YqeY domain fusion protein [Ignatzschineria rhizosphaerae]